MALPLHDIGYKKAYNRVMSIDEIVVEKNREKKIRGTVSVSQDEVDLLIKNELKGIKFSAPITVNLKIASPGLARLRLERNRIVGIKILIGKQMKAGQAELINSIIHEELEVRIHVRAYNYNISEDVSRVEQGDLSLHPYINKAIKKYFRIKGVE